MSAKPTRNGIIVIRQVEYTPGHELAHASCMHIADMDDYTRRYRAARDAAADRNQVAPPGVPLAEFWRLNFPNEEAWDDAHISALIREQHPEAAEVLTSVEFYGRLGE